MTPTKEVTPGHGEDCKCPICFGKRYGSMYKSKDEHIADTEVTSVLEDFKDLISGTVSWKAKPKVELTNEQRREAMLKAKKMRKVRDRKIKRKGKR